MFLYLLFLPTQFGKNFFFDFSFVNGVRVDYLALKIYFGDIIFLALLVNNLNLLLRIIKKNKFFFIIGSLLVVANIILSISKVLSLYFWIRYAQLVIIFFIFKEKKKILSSNLIFLGFGTMALFELFLSFFHFVFGHSFGGVFYFLGERTISVNTLGIALGYLGERYFLRPYGTFSHPNSLAGFYLLVYFYFLTQEKKINFVRKLLILTLSTLLVFFSFSKTAIFTYVFLNLIYFVKNNKCLLCLMAKTLIFFPVVYLFFLVVSDPLSFQKRLILLKNSIEILKTHILGTGLGGYLIAQSQLPSTLPLFFNQPVHNIFLLFLNELGILGVFFLAFFAKKIIEKRLNFYLLAVVLITGFFDHYWLTLYQNFFLIGVIFGLSIKSKIG